MININDVNDEYLANSDWIDVEENEEALELIKEKGFKNLPVVIASNKGFVFEFDGFQMDLLEGLVEK